MNECDMEHTVIGHKPNKSRVRLLTTTGKKSMRWKTSRKRRKRSGIICIKKLSVVSAEHAGHSIDKHIAAAAASFSRIHNRSVLHYSFM